MSQVAPKSQRPTLSLSAPHTTVGNLKQKQQRSNTPSTDKSDSRSSTPVIVIDDGQSPSPKGKRRVSNDSAKLRGSPKTLSPVVSEVESEVKNGKDHTNGANGAHVVDGNGVADAPKKESTPKTNKKEANGKKEKEEKTPKEEAKSTPEKKQKKQDLVLGEKTQPQMEKLVLEADTPADSPMPKGSGGRILKYTPGKGRISPFKAATVERLQNASTIVNLSTVSEQSTEGHLSPAVETPVKPPMGRVSGRRNTRPIKEIKMMHPTTANDSVSSITANQGSPVNSDSLRTPIIAQLIGRKRAGTPEREDDILVDTPSKRARIDFSGFLGYVTTPISNLKNRLSRIGLQASTPRALDMEENIADVSAMETEPAEKDVSKAVEASESVMEKEIEDLKATDADLKQTEIASNDPPTPTRRRSVCNIM
ncbi:neurofilament heavy polypeptide-like [Culicoides brevitarsis]|uniref:neurofilament heavy polypeptide-like n=1 Tax=Culicoides brevitarsis TaxID=469753 RepID=UPI00307C5ACD